MFDFLSALTLSDLRRDLEQDVIAEAQDVVNVTVCAHCGRPARPGSTFCSDQCRNRFDVWFREEM